MSASYQEWAGNRGDCSEKSDVVFLETCESCCTIQMPQACPGSGWSNMQTPKPFLAAPSHRLQKLFGLSASTFQLLLWRRRGQDSMAGRWKSSAAPTSTTKSLVGSVIGSVTIRWHWWCHHQLMMSLPILDVSTARDHTRVMQLPSSQKLNRSVVGCAFLVTTQLRVT